MPGRHILIAILAARSLLAGAPMDLGPTVWRFGGGEGGTSAVWRHPPAPVCAGPGRSIGLARGRRYTLHPAANRHVGKTAALALPVRTRMARPVTQPPDIHRHYAPRPDVLAQRLDDEVVVINLDSDHIFALNITAGRLWELLVAGHSPAEARDVLLSEFTGITASEVTDEIEATLAVWLAEGLMDGT